MMSIHIGMLIALAIGLVCGFKASESSLYPTEKLLYYWWRMSDSVKEGVKALVHKPKAAENTLTILKLIVDAQREQRQISEWDLMRNSGISISRAEKCIRYLVKSGVIVRQEGCESAILVDDIFYVIPITQADKAE